MKPYTHMYIMNVVMDNIQKTNGNVTIPSFGDFKVNETYKECVMDPNYQAYFRAGSIGPDGFPDLYTGQSMIHPKTDIWYEYLKHFAEKHNTKEAWSFFEGFKSHLITDAWTHDWVNSYSGGCWPDSDKLIAGDVNSWNNVSVHTAIEGSIDKIVQANSAGMTKTVNMPEAYMYDTLINSNQMYMEKDGQIIEGEDGKLYPEFLDAFVNSYWNTIGYENAMTHMAYMDAWNNDLEQGLRAWLKASEDAMQNMAHNDVDIFESVKLAYTDWGLKHYGSMSGVPDAIALLPDVFKNIMDFFNFEFFKQFKQFMANEICDYLIGMTLDELKESFSQEFKAEAFAGIIGANNCESVLSEMKTVPAVGQWNHSAVDPSVNAIINNSIISIKISMMTPEERNRLYHAMKNDGQSGIVGELDIVDKIRAIDCGGQMNLGAFREYYDHMQGSAFATYTSFYEKYKVNSTTCSKVGGCKLNPASKITVSDVLRTVQVVIKTKDVLWAGSDSDIRFGIQMKNGTKKSFNMDKSQYNDFERGDRDLYYFPVDVKNIKLADINGIFIEVTDHSDDWNCEYCEVSFNNKGFTKHMVNRVFGGNGVWSKGITV